MASVDAVSHMASTCLLSLLLRNVLTRMGIPPIHHRKDVHPVLHTADDVEWSGDGLTHGQVKHGVKEYAYYDYRHGVTHHTNHVESFWRLFKNSILSTHIHGSKKHMNRYLSEFAFRSNHRQMENAIFDLLIGAL